MVDPSGDSLDLILALARADEANLRLHERTCPGRKCPARSPEAPEPPSLFAGHQVPYDTQIAMAERQSTEGWDNYQLAEEFGYPVEVVEMVLSKLKGEYMRELIRRSSPWD